MKFKFLLLMFVPILFFSCNKTAKKAKTTGEPDVVIAYEDWSENKAFTLFAKYLLESKGYRVKTILVKNGLSALNAGKADVFLEKWMAKDIHVDGTEKLTVLGDIYQGGKLGLVVPNYMNIQSIEELKDMQKEIGNKIYSVGQGTEAFSGLNEAHKRYDLTAELIHVSETELFQLFDKRYMDRVPFCLTGWFPHPMLNKEYLKMLDDPYHAFETDYDLVKYCTRSWEKGHPKLFKFFKSYTFSEKQFNLLVKKMGENDWDLNKATVGWYKELSPTFTKMLE
ncbi:hypothetical protein K5X82_09695 [Halosquirtibacter xylanolyticus]|uniref:glycine betaine ABC transporter substrate-binding protein n=1 Tax=Halosquirtibacter xylanolyticus TaxID=3374599 RepID=UPI003747F088|nr:hypothetical protein K5X82_09695 [Prolixibacteraceae bacterium]